jgi:hypothetical protein
MNNVPDFAKSIPAHMWEADDRDDCLLYDGSVRLTAQGEEAVAAGDFSEAASITSGQDAVYELCKYAVDLGNGNQQYYMLAMSFFADYVFPIEEMLRERANAKLLENRIVYLFTDHNLALEAMLSHFSAHVSMHIADGV